MIRGYCKPSGRAVRPYVPVLLWLPGQSEQPSPVELLVDTGADRTLLGSGDALRLGIDTQGLRFGEPSVGVGGRASTRLLNVVVEIGDLSIPMPMPILDVRPGEIGFTVPSLMRRDLLTNFALFFDHRREIVLLLTPEEAARPPVL